MYVFETTEHFGERAELLLVRADETLFESFQFDALETVDGLAVALVPAIKGGFGHLEYLGDEAQGMPLGAQFDEPELLVQLGWGGRILRLGDFGFEALISKDAAKLEQRVEELKRKLAELTAGQSREKDPRRTFGIFQNDPDFEEAARLGREYREQQTYNKEIAGS